jgi:hypothetical protein
VKARAEAAKERAEAAKERAVAAKERAVAAMVWVATVATGTGGTHL